VAQNFCGLLGFIETNAYLAWVNFKDGCSNVTRADFRRILAAELINNRFLIQPHQPLSELPSGTVHLPLKFEKRMADELKGAVLSAPGDTTNRTRYTVWHCSKCGDGFPLCAPCKRSRFEDHVHKPVVERFRRRVSGE